jgi:hypothetical protein
MNNFEEYIGEFKNNVEVQNKMKILNINNEQLKDLIKEFTIQCDYDEVLVDLITPWINSINKKQGTNYTNEIPEFHFFEKIEGGLDYLSIPDVYQTEVKPFDNSLKFIQTLSKLNLMENFHIVTSTVSAQHDSKIKQIKEIFPEINIKNVHTTSNKGELSRLNSVLIDDAIHNNMNVVENNSYAYAMILNKSWNKDMKVGKRVKRIDDINDFFKFFPMLVLENYERFINKTHLLVEHLPSSMREQALNSILKNLPQKKNKNKKSTSKKIKK